jgi:hypothetical protein
MAERTVQLDAVNLRKNAKYLKNGLTITSDNVSIHPRDAAGNIMLHENSETNPLLIIEPTATKISNNSMLKILNTRFEYFKFPVSTTTPSAVNLDAEIDLSIIPDLIYSRYKPANNQQIPVNVDPPIPSGLEFSEVADGQPQVNTNAYYITKEIKNSGKDLRFRIKIFHTYQSGNVSSEYGSSYFTIIKNGPNTAGLERVWRGPFANFPADGTEGEDGYGLIKTGEIQILTLDEIIPNSEFEIGDTFGIGGYSGQDIHTLIADQSYWVITDASKNVDLWNQPIE